MNNTTGTELTEVAVAFAVFTLLLLEWRVVWRVGDGSYP
jgi:hypothetical protein